MRHDSFTRLTLLLLLLLPCAALGQSTGFQLNRYEPTPAGEWSFAVDHPWYSLTRPFAAGLTFNYGHDPLVYGLRSANGDFTQQQVVIQHQLLMHLDIAGSIDNRLTMSASFPVTLVERGTTVDGVGPLGGPAAGDLRLGAMLRVWGQPNHDAISVNLGINLWVPFGLEDKLTGDTGVRALPKVVLAGVTNHLSWSGSAGFYYRPSASIGSVPDAPGSQVGPSLQIGGSLYYADWARRFAVGPELLLLTTVTDGHAFKKDFTSLELLAGSHYSIASQVNLGLALGIGTLRDPGTPDFRLLVRLAYAPFKENQPPKPTCKDDAKLCTCKDDPKLLMQWGLWEGCQPKPTLTCKDDRSLCTCKDDPKLLVSWGMWESCQPKQEQKPGPPPSCAPFPVLNIEFDFDKDNIKDAPENHTALKEIVDRLKASPQFLLVEVRGHADRRGTKQYNLNLTDRRAKSVMSYLVEHGVEERRLKSKGIGAAEPLCKEREEATVGKEACWAKNRRVEFVVLQRADICPVEEIQFDLDKARIKPESYHIIDSVAASVLGNGVQLLEIQGHSDERGSDEHNLRLTNERAQAVMKYMIDLGVEAGKLTSRGYGKTQPLCTESNEECWRRNRRVDFVVLEPAPCKPFPRQSDPSYPAPGWKCPR